MHFCSAFSVLPSGLNCLQRGFPCNRDTGRCKYNLKITLECKIGKQVLSFEAKKGEDYTLGLVFLRRIHSDASQNIDMDSTIKMHPKFLVHMNIGSVFLRAKLAMYHSYISVSIQYKAIFNGSLMYFRKKNCNVN